jgi:hypothetical protein
MNLNQLFIGQISMGKLLHCQYDISFTSVNRQSRALVLEGTMQETEKAERRSKPSLQSLLL